MPIVIIDNYDSFTYNLFHLISSVATSDVRVIANDDYSAWHSIDLETVDALIISSGPGRPELESDFGVSRLALNSDVPLLGVGLGHQGLCYWEGGALTTTPETVPGRTSAIQHDGSGIFAGIPSPFLAARYHTLTVDDVPDSLRITACTIELAGRKVVMGVEHRSRPQWGVQFNPESIATQYGRELMDNFLQVARCRRARRISLTASGAGARREGIESVAAGPTQTRRVQLISRRLSARPDCERLYSRLFGDEGAFWLDSSAVMEGLSRFSILGGCGPHGEWVNAEANGGVTVRHSDGRVTRVEQSIFDYLERETAERAVSGIDCECGFALGYVGYLGYEMKSECGGDAAHRSELPDAGFVFCDRAVVFDHNLGQTWLLALASQEVGDEAQATSWLNGAERAVRESLSGGVDQPERSSSRPLVAAIDRKSLTKYVSNVKQCMREIRAGETHQICLTTTVTVDAAIDTVRTYRNLRRRIAAPYGALLRFPGVDVLCASPERFLKISADRMVEAKSSKGSCRRGRTSEEDLMLAHELRTAMKDRSENLMILDLLRNDLGRVARATSVQVPLMFAVETSATVHRLVSTVRARLRDDVSPVQCVRAAFPGGSVTGAPKRRTMQIIDRLEGGPRGINSGAIGYFSLSGAVDLNIVTQTMVVHEGRITIGTGGAISALSRIEDELTNMGLEAHALLESIRATPENIACRFRERAPESSQEKRRVGA